MKMIKRTSVFLGSEEPGSDITVKGNGNCVYVTDSGYFATNCSSTAAFLCKTKGEKYPVLTFGNILDV